MAAMSKSGWQRPGSEEALSAGRHGVVDVVEEGVRRGLGQDLQVLERDGVQDHDGRGLRWAVCALHMGSKVTGGLICSFVCFLSCVFGCFLFRMLSCILLRTQLLTRTTQTISLYPSHIHTSHTLVNGVHEEEGALRHQQVRHATPLQVLHTQVQRRHAALELLTERPARHPSVPPAPLATCRCAAGLTGCRTAPPPSPAPPAPRRRRRSWGRSA